MLRKLDGEFFGVVIFFYLFISVLWGFEGLTLQVFGGRENKG